MHTTDSNWNDREMSRIILTISFFIFMSACSSATLKTNTNVYTHAPFATFTTFAWQDFKNDGSVPEASQLLIRSQIQKELVKNGYTMVPKEEADFLVRSIVNIGNASQTSGPTTKKEFTERRIGIDRQGQFINVEQFKQRQELEKQQIQILETGTLMIDYLDARTEKLLVRSIAQKVLPENPVDKQTQKTRVLKVVSDLVNEFPPENSR